jgi:hypothetical protein
MSLFEPHKPRRPIFESVMGVVIFVGIVAAVMGVIYLLSFLGD